MGRDLGYTTNDMTNLQTEEWRDIPGFPYQASSLGRIRRAGKTSNPDQPEKTIATRAHSRGYVTATLYTAGSIKKQVFVHRMVAAAFIGVDSRLVNHKNGVKTDNRAENLEYMTPLENTAHAIEMGLAAPRRKLGPLEVRTIRIERRAGAKASDLAREFNVSPAAISCLCRGKTYVNVL
jgi:hypothetical protein